MKAHLLGLSFIISTLLPSTSYSCTWEVQVKDLRSTEVKYYQPSGDPVAIDLTGMNTSATCTVHTLRTPDLTANERRIFDSTTKAEVYCRYPKSPSFSSTAFFARFKDRKERLSPVMLYLYSDQPDSKQTVSIHVGCKEGMIF